MTITVSRNENLLEFSWNRMEIEEDVIHRGWRPRWVTASEICLIVSILRKPNSIIVLLLIQNISTFLTNLTPCRLVLWSLYFSARFKDVNRCFILAVTSQKVDNIHRLICFAYSCIYSVQFWSKIQPFRLRKAVNNILFSLLVNKHSISAWKRGWSMDYCPM